MLRSGPMSVCLTNYMPHVKFALQLGESRWTYALIPNHYGQHHVIRKNRKYTTYGSATGERPR